MLVTLDPWGSLSLRHAAFGSDAYYWLEFTIRAASAEQPDLEAFFHAAGGDVLASAPVNDPRHLDGGTIVVDPWKRVRIPLRDLNAHGDVLERLNIKNRSGARQASFWIDDLRLVGAKEPEARTFLPLLVR